MAGTILVVDDDPDFVELVQALLRNQYSVEGCTDSKFAIERIRQINPMLVFLDLNMPSPTGWDLLRSLREDPAFSKLPVLVVSAAGAETVFPGGGLRRDLVGPVNVLSKPFEIDDLLMKVKSLLQGQAPPSSGDPFTAEASSRVGSTS